MTALRILGAWLWPYLSERSGFQLPSELRPTPAELVRQLPDG